MGVVEGETALAWRNGGRGDGVVPDDDGVAMFTVRGVAKKGDAVCAVVVGVVDVVEVGEVTDAVRRDAPPVRHIDYAILPASRARNLRPCVSPAFHLQPRK